jgi:hypothetical protein
MLKEVHFLLTYGCTYECDHCFLHCSPSAPGTFTVEDLYRVFDQIAAVDSVERVYFEGGEAFLYYPLLVEGVRRARAQHLEVGIVTNSYWATSVADAELWLRPLAGMGIADLSVSDDGFHGSDPENSPAKLAFRAARNLGIPVDSICIDEPKLEGPAEGKKGESVVGGGVKFRGRAVDKLLDDLPGRPAAEYPECPYEELQSPMRVHVDPFGNVHLCQGLLMGNLWRTPLAELLAGHDAGAHPICGPLVRGGPAELARVLGVDDSGRWVDACHLCYVARRGALADHPEHLGPVNVYGLEPQST